MFEILRKLIPTQGLQGFSNRSHAEYRNVTLRNAAGGWWLLTPEQYHNVCRALVEVPADAESGPEACVLHDSIGRAWKLSQDQYYEFIELFSAVYLKGVEENTESATSPSVEVQTGRGSATAVDAAEAPADTSSPEPARVETEAVPALADSSVSEPTPAAPVIAKGKGKPGVSKSKTGRALNGGSAPAAGSPVRAVDEGANIADHPATNPTAIDDGERLNEQVRNLSAALAAAEKKLKAAEKELATLSERAEDAEKAGTEAAERADSAESKVFELTQHAEALEERLNAEAKRARDLEKKLAAATKRAENCRSEASAAKAEAAEASVRADVAETELSALRGRVKALLGE